MDNRYNRQLLEQYEEAAMMLLMDEYAEADGARLLEAFEDAEKQGQTPVLSPNLDDRCRKQIKTFFDRQARTARIRKSISGLVKAAAYGIVLLGLSATLVLSVDALRVPVLNFILEQKEKCSILRFDDQTHPPESHASVLSTGIAHLIPADYTLILETAEDSGTIHLFYQNSRQETFSVDITPASGQLLVDTEGTEQQEVSVNGHEAVFFSGDGYRILWTDAEAQLIYMVYAENMDLDIFWKIVYYLAA